MNPGLPNKKHARLWNSHSKRLTTELRKPFWKICDQGESSNT